MEEHRNRKFFKRDEKITEDKPIVKKIRLSSTELKGNKNKQAWVSSRRYPAKKCKKESCNEEFIPSDSRHLYCSKQHRIDHNNDKRKEVDEFDINFTKSAKKNRSILIKIENSTQYIRDEYINFSFLDYEGYNFNTYHSIKIDSNSKREVKFCYEYGIILIASEKNLFKIIKKTNK